VPIYPYACTACGHTFEAQQSFTDPSLTQCPECSGRLRKVFSSVGVVFKGSGFYRTDSRSSSGSDSGSGSSTKAASGSKDGGSTSSGSSTSGSGGTTTSTTSGSSSSGSSATPAAAKKA
jgi:putative FmdB family regulatory protein